MASPRQRTRADGTIAWQALYRDHGKQRSATFPTAQARDQWIKLVTDIGLDAALEVLNTTEHGSSGIPLLADYALADVEERTGISEGTRDRYRREIRRDWKKIGALPTNLVTASHIKRWVRDLERAGASAKTIRNKHGFLSSVLDHATHDPAIEMAINPCEETGKHLRKDDVKDEMVSLTQGEYAILLGCVPLPYRIFVTALFGPGMRFGEATALTVADYDEDTRKLSIAKAWKKVPGGWKVGPPKTRRGRRKIRIPDQLVGYCEAAKVQRGPAELLFRGARGGRIKHSTFYPDVWAPAIRLANGQHGWPDKGAEYAPSKVSMWCGISPMPEGMRLGKWPRIHDARHTAASWMIAAGATLQDVQYQLGHESIQTTSDRYADLLPGRGEATAAALSLALSQALPELGG
ncbi:MAG: site-specific integrase [Corynebacterium variabile]|nr:site-specific integrase [Corynebacterium variabile]